MTRRDGKEQVPDFIRDYVSWGAGPRASQYLVLAAKARAVLHGRYYVSTEDVRAVAFPVLRHRIVTNFNAEAEGLKPDDILARLIKAVPVDESEAADGGKLTRSYLDPRILASLQGLDLQARMVVEGYVSGLHKSPYHGFSVEFAEHREYVAGDDVRHVDWKVWSKTDKYYLKQYEEETNLLTYLLLDTSESMAYASDGNVTKLQYAQFVAAALAYMVLQQQDSVGLATFDEQGPPLPQAQRPAVAPEGDVPPDGRLARRPEVRPRR